MFSKGDRVQVKGKPSKTGTAQSDEYTDGNLNMQCVIVLWDGGKRATPNFARNLVKLP